MKNFTLLLFLGILLRVCGSTFAENTESADNPISCTANGGTPVWKYYAAPRDKICGDKATEEEGCPGNVKIPRLNPEYGNSKPMPSAADVPENINTAEYGFIENKGQMVDREGKPNPDVLYMKLTSGLKVQLTRSGFSYECYRLTQEENEETPAPKVLQTHRVDVVLENINPYTEVVAEEPAADYLNYYTTGTPEAGVTGVRHYRKVTYKNIYPEIDMEFVINENPKSGSGVEYNFIIRPGGKVEYIRLQYKGANELTLTDDGKLEIATSIGNIEENIPYSYQPRESNKAEQEIPVSYLGEGNTFGFKANAYDKTKALIIDPAPNLL